MKRIILCRSGCGGKCPEVFIEKDGIRIEDDYLNSIYMTHEQFEVLKEKIETGEL